MAPAAVATAAVAPAAVEPVAVAPAAVEPAAVEPLVVASAAGVTIASATVRNDMYVAQLNVNRVGMPSSVVSGAVEIRRRPRKMSSVHLSKSALNRDKGNFFTNAVSATFGGSAVEYFSDASFATYLKAKSGQEGNTTREPIIRSGARLARDLVSLSGVETETLLPKSHFDSIELWRYSDDNT